MFENTKAFSGFSVSDLDKAKAFYGVTLGIHIEEDGPGFTLHLAGGTNVFVYPKEDHTPATFTILNFEVENIELAVDQLAEKGVTMEHYGGSIPTDDKGILWGKKENMGPNIAWFTDPAGNVLSVIEN